MTPIARVHVCAHARPRDGQRFSRSMSSLGQPFSTGISSLWQRLSMGISSPASSAPLAVTLGGSMRMPSRLAAATICLLLWHAAPAAGSEAEGGGGEAPMPVTLSERPPEGHRLSPDRALEIAGALPKIRRLREAHPQAEPSVYLKGKTRWQVSWFSRSGKEIAQVIVADSSGRVLEVWTGIQVAWTMARGYNGAFGGIADSLYVWLPLCLLFVVPFFDWRKPLRLLHLDLVMLLSLSVSLAFFDHREIFDSVPLVYPPLLYLLLRMLTIAFRRAPPPRLTLTLPVRWLAAGVVVLVCFRIALNLVNGNVIDVGYAGVIGAQRIATGGPLYRGYPKEDAHGDTYAPFNYEAYLPFQQVLGWSGTWDSLPAAHAAAIAFDLLSLLLLFLLGRRVRGPSLGVALCWAWVTYPFTLYVLESDSNDALVAATVLAALLAIAYRRGAAETTSAGGSVGAPSPSVSPHLRRAAARSRIATGALAALSALTKIAPLALAPLLASDGLRGMSRRSRVAALTLFAVGFVLATALAMLPALRHDSPSTIFDRTIAYQAGRVTPFSIWGLYGLPLGRTIVEGIAAAGALILAFLPRRPGVLSLSACCAAILIALQLGLDYWFYLYVVWFFPLAMVALLGPLSRQEPVRSGAASLSAQSRPLSVAASS